MKEVSVNNRNLHNKELQGVFQQELFYKLI